MLDLNYRVLRDKNATRFAQQDARRKSERRKSRDALGLSREFDRFHVSAARASANTDLSQLKEPLPLWRFLFTYVEAKLQGAGVHGRCTGLWLLPIHRAVSLFARGFRWLLFLLFVHFTLVAASRIRANRTRRIAERFPLSDTFSQKTRVTVLRRDGAQIKSSVRINEFYAAAAAAFSLRATLGGSPSGFYLIER